MRGGFTTYKRNSATREEGKSANTAAKAVGALLAAKMLNKINRSDHLLLLFHGKEGNP